MLQAFTTDPDLVDFSIGDLPEGEAQALYSLWQNRRGSRRMPARADMSPEDMKAMLPRIALVDVLRDPADFRVRLWGTELVDRSGIELTGQRVDFPGVRERAEWVVRHRAPYFIFERPITWSDRTYRFYDALALPLGKDGESVDMILYWFRFR